MIKLKLNLVFTATLVALMALTPRSVLAVQLTFPARGFTQYLAVPPDVHEIFVVEAVGAAGGEGNGGPPPRGPRGKEHTSRVSSR